MAQLLVRESKSSRKEFQEIHTISHSPDGLALYDNENELLFGGDTFFGPDYLVTQLSPLAEDLERTAI